MRTFALLLTILAFAAAPASAQVFRCKDAAGRTIYSDHACGEGRQEVQNLGVNTLDQSGARAAQQRRVCPSEQDIAGLELRLLQPNKRAEQDFFAGELRRARACNKEGGNYSADDWEKIKAAQDGQAYKTSRDRKAARAVAESIHAPSTSDRENTRMNADNQAQATRDAGRAAAAAANRQLICHRVGQQLICN